MATQSQRMANGILPRPPPLPGPRPSHIPTHPALPANPRESTMMPPATGPEHRRYEAIRTRPSSRDKGTATGLRRNG